jgi:hypothetical protein
MEREERNYLMAQCARTQGSSLVERHVTRFHVILSGRDPDKQGLGECIHCLILLQAYLLYIERVQEKVSCCLDQAAAINPLHKVARLLN